MGRKVKDCLDLKSVKKARRMFVGRAKRGHPSGKKLKVCGKRSYDNSVRTLTAGGDQSSLQRMVLRSLSKSAKKKKARREAAEAKPKPPGKKKLFNPKANLLS